MAAEPPADLLTGLDDHTADLARDVYRRMLDLGFGAEKATAYLAEILAARANSAPADPPPEGP